MSPSRTITVPLAAVLAAATLAAPATARPIDSPASGRHAESTIAPSQDLRSPDARDAANGRTPRDAATRTWRNLTSPDAQDAAAGRGTFNAPDVTVIEVPRYTRSPRGGVDWADAAIGAGGATGLLAISLAGAMTLRRRQTGPRSQAAIS
jgi:hypothetical protein